ncbi:hypothetical protein [Synechococcus sp. M16CYN]
MDVYRAACPQTIRCLDEREEPCLIHAYGLLKTGEVTNEIK